MSTVNQRWKEGIKIENAILEKLNLIDFEILRWDNNFEEVCFLTNLQSFTIHVGVGMTKLPIVSEVSLHVGHHGHRVTSQISDTCPYTWTLDTRLQIRPNTQVKTKNCKIAKISFVCLEN